MAGRFDDPFYAGFISFFFGIFYTLFVMPESNANVTKPSVIIEIRTPTTTTTTTAKKTTTDSGKEDNANPMFVKLNPQDCEKALGKESKVKDNSDLGFQMEEEESSLSRALSIVTATIDAFRSSAAVTDYRNTEKTTPSPLSSSSSLSVKDAPEDEERQTGADVPHDAATGFTTGVVSVSSRRRCWNWRLILPTLTFFFAFAGDSGERLLLTLFVANFPFCWDADELGDVTTARLFLAFGVSALALTAARKAKIDDYVIAASCIALAAASHVGFAFTGEVSMV